MELIYLIICVVTYGVNSKKIDNWPTRSSDGLAAVITIHVGFALVSALFFFILHRGQKKVEIEYKNKFIVAGIITMAGTFAMSITIFTFDAKIFWPIFASGEVLFFFRLAFTIMGFFHYYRQKAL